VGAASATTIVGDLVDGTPLLAHDRHVEPSSSIRRNVAFSSLSCSTLRLPTVENGVENSAPQCRLRVAVDRGHAPLELDVLGDHGLDEDVHLVEDVALALHSQ